MSLPVAVSAEGVRLYDEQGKEYLDGSSGVLNVNLGHGNKEVLRAIGDQLRELTFVHRSQFTSHPVRQLTQELLEVAPTGVTHVEYTNSGSEANECALRIALAFQHRSGESQRTVVLSERPSYHGMTAGALALTGHPAKRDPSVEPLLAGGVAHRPVLPEPGALRAGVQQWRSALAEVGRNRVAAVLVEPVGGASSGAAAMTRETLRWLRSEADRGGFLLIADEVMSGFGRTGRWWACDHADVAPDLLTSGKGLTGGYTTLAVVLVAERVVAAMGAPLGGIVLGHTMSGNPLSAATSLAVLRQLREHDLPGRAGVVGQEVRATLAELRDRHPAVTEVRGHGLMLGLGIAGNPARPMETARRLVALAREQGLVICSGGIDTVTESVLFAPPLTVTLEDAQEMARRLDKALQHLPR